MAAVKPVPDGYPQVIPYSSVDGATEAIEFYKEVFGAGQGVLQARAAAVMSG